MTTSLLLLHDDYSKKKAINSHLKKIIMIKINSKQKMPSALSKGRWKEGSFCLENAIGIELIEKELQAVGQDCINPHRSISFDSKTIHSHFFLQILLRRS